MKETTLTDPDALRITLEDGSVWMLNAALTMTCVKKAKRPARPEEILSLF